MQPAKRSPSMSEPGPFRADQIREGDPYELSNGHPIRCMSSGGSHGRTSLLGGSVLDSDPAVTGAGVDVGISPEPKVLRAPDVAIGVPDEAGWLKTVPPLVVEVADVGQDEGELQDKIAEYFTYGVRYVWVVRKVGPRRVEAYETGKRMRTHLPGEDLLAPGALQNPVPVLAWFERDQAHDVTLRNLLQRKGYGSLEEVRAEGSGTGRLVQARQAVLTVLAARGLEVSETVRARIETCAELPVLERWLARAVSEKSAAAALE